MLGEVGGDTVGGMSTFLSVFLTLAGGPHTGLLVCGRCRDKLSDFVHFWNSCRTNLTRLKEIKDEQMIHREQEKPDSTCDNAKELNDDDKDVLQISVTDEMDIAEPLNYSDNTITITKIEKQNSLEDKECREQNRVTEFRTLNNNNYTLYPQPQTCGLDLTSKHSVNARTEDEDITTKSLNSDQSIEVRRYSEEVVSPPPSSELVDSTPILVSCDQPEDDHDRDEDYHKVALSSEERRRHRNREASRRYREKARSDPELLKKMREQQNKRQKKYYARLKERKNVPIENVKIDKKPLNIWTTMSSPISLPKTPVFNIAKMT